MEIKRWVKRGRRNNMPYEYVDAVFYVGTDGYMYLQYKRCTQQVRVLYCFDYRKRLHIDYGVDESCIPDAYRNFIRKYINSKKQFMTAR